MTPDAVGIIIAIFVGFIAIALSIFFGLKTFTGNLGRQISDTKDSLVKELSGIRDRVIKIEGTADNIWDVVKEKLFGLSGTIEFELRNFGKTKVTAEPGADETRYIVKFERVPVIINEHLLGRMSNITGLTETEIEMFNSMTRATVIGSNMIKVTIPSTDPEACVKYMSLFLKWLDTEYVTKLKASVEEFEKGIKV